MISEELFDKILLEPALQGAEKLCIVSGFASAAMVSRHFEILNHYKKPINIELIVGMCPYEGISLSNHLGFLQMVEDRFKKRFVCSYVFNGPPVHSKLYIWLKNEEPFYGFTGSANYTQPAFIGFQKEVMAVCDHKLGYRYFESLSSDTIYCNHIQVEDSIRIYNDKYYAQVKRDEKVGGGMHYQGDLDAFQKITVSFLDKNGDLPQRSGLNWGQRHEENREPNQAYIRLPARIYKTDFFPNRTIHFTIITDDNKVLICTRAQDNGKAIHTPHNNSLLGEYFRNRLSLASGIPVSKDDLLRYGRTDVDIYKIDEETYFLDFSVNNNG